MIRLQTYRRDSGFTLLEVLLALGLSVVVIGAIGIAIRLHLITLNRQQAEIESKQVARSVIMMITNDVRAAIQYRAQDFSALENLALSQQMILGITGAMQDGDMDGALDGGLDGALDGGLSGGLDDLGGAAASAGIGNIGGAGAATGESGGIAGTQSGGSGIQTGGAGEQSGGVGEQSGASNSGGTGSAGAGSGSEMVDCASCRPTFIGTATTISVDASRLPRIDQYNPLIAVEANLVQTPSDIKSIAYFVDESAPPSQQIRFESRAEVAPGGLYRRQIDRSVAAYRDETGLIQVDDHAQLVAPEVAQISMRYFDGEQWVSDWDSEEIGRFPIAVEIVLVMDPARSMEGGYQYSGFDPNTMKSYRTVIHLPTAEIEEEE